jgi:hypothetical protein
VNAVMNAGLSVVAEGLCSMEYFTNAVTLVRLGLLASLSLTFPKLNDREKAPIHVYFIFHVSRSSAAVTLFRSVQCLLIGTSF